VEVLVLVLVLVWLVVLVVLVLLVDGPTAVVRSVGQFRTRVRFRMSGSQSTLI
jgi:hypothetical protein